MQAILEYIMLNYTWFLVGSIIILLAIIGYYADKTNFGQGKIKEKDDINKDNINEKALEGKRMEDLLGENKKKSIVIEEPTQVQNIPLNSNDILTQDNIIPQNAVLQENVALQNAESSNNEIDSLKNSEENFEKFDKEFNELLPKKEIINDDLLDEIDSLSLDKTQRINISDIPDVDDVDLPDIKTLPQEEEDIWKF